MQAKTFHYIQINVIEANSSRLLSKHFIAFERMEVVWPNTHIHTAWILVWSARLRCKEGFKSRGLCMEEL